jgi:hypothetical protein
MALKDELEAEMTYGLTRCKVGRFLDTIDPKDAAELEAAFVNQTYPTEVVRRVMVKRGFDGGITVCHRHAKKDCCCVD